MYCNSPQFQRVWMKILGSIEETDQRGKICSEWHSINNYKETVITNNKICKIQDLEILTWFSKYKQY